METRMVFSFTTLTRDIMAGLVVFLVALPLCLGVAKASEAPFLAGIIAGIVGGIVVGILSGSHTSVSGPAAGLTVIVAAQIKELGSFEAFLTVVVLAGILQFVLGYFRTGVLSAFFPSSVINGLLTAIGVILILKQAPHLVGHDPDPVGEMSFIQPDQKNTFSEIVEVLDDFHMGSLMIGLGSLLLLVLWDRIKVLKKSPIPVPLVVVVLGVVVNELFRGMGEGWAIDKREHLVNVPVADTIASFLACLKYPAFTLDVLGNRAIYAAAVTLAIVASLETLLNLEGVDKLDPKQRTSPPNRELMAQGCGNIVCGLVGGLPITSVIIRSSANVNAGGRTKMATIIHGVFLLVSVLFLARVLNLIPLSCLAAILFMTGIKLASPKLVRKMWSQGLYQFLPFAATVIAIVLTDLLIGVVIGLGISGSFILWSNVRRPIRRIVEKHLGGDVVNIELANQVSILNRAALSRVLDEVPEGGHVLFNAEHTDYIDPDILDLLHEFQFVKAPARGIGVSLRGFRDKYQLEDRKLYIDYSTRELQSSMTPEQVLQALRDGHERFRTGHRLTRDLGRLVTATASGQHPIAVVLSCIDSRTPAEVIFDLCMGDIFVVRIAGNVISGKVLGSIEYACAIAGAKLILVMGHTRCGAVTATLDHCASGKSAAETSGCQHLDHIINDIRISIDPATMTDYCNKSTQEKEKMVDRVAVQNVVRSVSLIREESSTLAALVESGKLMIVPAIYNVATGHMDFLLEAAAKADPALVSTAVTLANKDTCAANTDAVPRNTPYPL